MRFSVLALSAAAAAVNAQNPQQPGGASICDRYTQLLLRDNSPQSQQKLLTMLVNTALIGNYTQPNVGVRVPGILTAGESEGQRVDLMPYFNGARPSTNTGGQQGESVNFLDGGGAEPLRRNLPANDNRSRQFVLMTHLYSFFGSILRCSTQGAPGFDQYNGRASMFEVHQFMGLNHAEISYFVQQVGLAAASFGVHRADVDAIANQLNGVFNVRCGQPAAVVPGQGPQPQSICTDPHACPAAPGAACDRYPGQPGPAQYPGQPGPAQYPGQPRPDQYPGQPRPDQYPGQYPGQPGQDQYPGQPRPDQYRPDQYPGQPRPDQVAGGPWTSAYTAGGPFATGAYTPGVFTASAYTPGAFTSGPNPSYNPTGPLSGPTPGPLSPSPYPSTVPTGSAAGKAVSLAAAAAALAALLL
ncbi:hypothetical protein CDD83_8382 [Cordyceps sp. RAO-2017]|nr:hypothetical protein CDD83_8382 [Cordyceps sp. RAO-2017]